MEFLNEPVHIEKLPKAEDVPFTPVEHAYLQVLRWQWAISMFLLIAIWAPFVIFIPSLQKTTIILFTTGSWALLAAIWYIIMQLSFSARAYVIRERDVMYKSGLIIRSLHVSPFNRIQHCTVTAGPLDRRYGLATLVLYTAGANATDLHIPGLKEEQAHTLKEYITKKIADEPTGEL
jgi:uncharacterized protein